MRAFLFYFLQVFIASGILWLYYHLFLRNHRFHQYNRFFLLLSTVLSLVIPLLTIDIYFPASQNIPAVYQVMAEVRASDVIDVNSSSFIGRESVIQFIFWIITGLLFIRLFLSLLHIMQLKRNHPSEKLQNILFINTQEKGTPFSFFRWLFWNKKIKIDSPAGQKIFRHELFHIQQMHTWDIICLELLTTIFWINPFFHLVKKETKAIHEFLADQFAAGRDNKWEYAELLVMQTLQTRQRLVNPFFHNQIKRRIAMITNSSKSSYQYLRKLMVLPLGIFIVTIVAVNCTSKDIKDVSHDPVEQKVKELKPQLEDLKKQLNDSTVRSKDDPESLPIEERKEEPVDQNQRMIFSDVEVAASFPGGTPGWREFLNQKLNSLVPVNNGAPEGKYTVMTQFIVDKNGRIGDIKALTHFGYGMEEEVLRVMKLSPAWSPAKQNGHAVNSYRKQPVTFFISAE